MDCIFCKIIDGNINCNKVYEDEDFIVILDAFPANEGHCLVIPKVHTENIFNAEEPLVEKAFSLAQKTAKAIKSSLNIENINILQNNGQVAGQTIFHFHIHIVPRKENDSVTIKSEVINLSEQKINDIKNAIKSSF